VQRGLPLFAICRGLQEINVSLGGSLLQAVHEEPGRFRPPGRSDHEPEEQYGPSHPVDVVAGGELDRILGLGQLQVNSLHGQAIDRLARVFESRRWHPTHGEAVHISAHPGFALAVQWHPEWKVLQNPASTCSFARLEMPAARRWRAGSAQARRPACHALPDLDHGVARRFHPVGPGTLLRRKPGRRSRVPGPRPDRRGTRQDPAAHQVHAGSRHAAGRVGPCDDGHRRSPDSEEYDAIISPSDYDMELLADPTTVCLVPWVPAPNRTAQIIHDCYFADGRLVDFAPRSVLRRVRELYQQTAWNRWSRPSWSST